MPFEDISGHRMPVRILRSMLSSGNVPHAFLFFGTDGIGKRTVALCFARALNCRERKDDFCGSCVSCNKILHDTHPDVVCIEPEEGKNVIVIDQVRSMQDAIDFAPVEGTTRVFIFDQAEKLNNQAANCLLKVLEEPPPHTVIVLVAHDTTDMLPTVLSRCQQIRFSPLSRDDVVGLLSGKGIDPAEAKAVAPYCGGSPGKAVYYCESGFLEKRDRIAGILSNRDRDPAAVDGLAQEIGADREGFFYMVEFFQLWYRDLLFVHDGLSGSSLYNADMAEKIQAAAAMETRHGIVKKINQLQWLQQNRSLNPDLQLGMESVLFS